MFLIVVLALISSAAADTHTRCTNIPSGYCISLLSETCPSGSYVSYSGCGFLEQCCYNLDTQPAQTTPSHVQSTSHCGVSDYNPDQKIVGGTETVIEKYPWQVSIRFRDIHTCGGTIINDRWILTAAHCIREKPQPVYTTDFTVVAGSTNQQNVFHSDYNHYYYAQYVIPHQGYQKYINNDLTLIKVNRTIDLAGNQKRPICLAEAGDDFTGQVCVATGWGSKAEGDDQEDLLREVDLPIVSHSLCTYYIGWVDTNNLCAGPRYGGKDTCQGDSGGPLVCQNPDGVWVQAGIVSYGQGCAHANVFGVYTDVSKYRDWIQDVMSRY